MLWIVQPCNMHNMFCFYSTRTLIDQQSPKLTLTGSDMGLVLIASASLITKRHIVDAYYRAVLSEACAYSGGNRTEHIVL